MRNRMPSACNEMPEREGLRDVAFDVDLAVRRLIDVDDDHRLGLFEEEPDAREAVFDAVGLRKAALLEQLPHPLLGLDLLKQGCHAGSMFRAPATDQDIVVPTLRQLRSKQATSWRRDVGGGETESSRPRNGR